MAEGEGGWRGGTVFPRSHDTNRAHLCNLSLGFYTDRPVGCPCPRAFRCSPASPSGLSFSPVSSVPLAPRPAPQPRPERPRPVPVGEGSYASFPPNITDPKLQQFLLGPAHVDASVADRPIPTNKWWSNLLMSQFPGNLWAYPLVVNADDKGLEILAPKAWNDTGSDMLLSAPLRLTGVVPQEKRAKSEVLADFEGEDYPPGWNGQGTAFGTGPAKGAIEGETPVDGYEGQSLASSFHGGDRSVGELDSPDFRIDRKTIHFLIGGGRTRRTCTSISSSTTRSSARPPATTTSIWQWKVVGRFPMGGPGRADPHRR